MKLRKQVNFDPSPHRLTHLCFRLLSLPQSSDTEVESQNEVQVVDFRFSLSSRFLQLIGSSLASRVEFSIVGKQIPRRFVDSSLQPPRSRSNDSDRFGKVVLLRVQRCETCEIVDTELRNVRIGVRETIGVASPFEGVLE